MKTAASAREPAAEVAGRTAEESTGIPRERRSRRVGRFVRHGVPPVVSAVAFVALWDLVARTAFHDRAYLVPGPRAVVEAAIADRSLLAQASWSTFVSSVTAYGLAILVGVGAAAVMSQSRNLIRALYPYAVVLQTVPIIAIAPVIVLWFRYGRKSIIVIALLVSIFPIMSNTLLGLISVSSNQLDLFRLHRANRWTMLRKLRIPAALPSIGAGLRVSAGMSVIGATVGEFLVGQGGARGGLGVAIIVSQARLQTDLLFAEALLATLLAVAMFLAVNFVVNRSLRSWHESALGVME